MYTYIYNVKKSPASANDFVFFLFCFVWNLQFCFGFQIFSQAQTNVSGNCHC